MSERVANDGQQPNTNNAEATQSRKGISRRSFLKDVLGWGATVTGITTTAAVVAEGLLRLQSPENTDSPSSAQKARTETPRTVAHTKNNISTPKATIENTSTATSTPEILQTTEIVHVSDKEMNEKGWDTEGMRELHLNYLDEPKETAEDMVALCHNNELVRGVLKDMGINPDTVTTSHFHGKFSFGDLQNGELAKIIERNGYKVDQEGINKLLGIGTDNVVMTFRNPVTGKVGTFTAKFRDLTPEQLTKAKREDITIHAKSEGFEVMIVNNKVILISEICVNPLITTLDLEKEATPTASATPQPPADTPTPERPKDTPTPKPPDSPTPAPTNTHAPMPTATRGVEETPTPKPTELPPSPTPAPTNTHAPMPTATRGVEETPTTAPVVPTATRGIEAATPTPIPVNTPTPDTHPATPTPVPTVLPTEPTPIPVSKSEQESYI